MRGQWAVVALTVLVGVHSPAVDHGFLNRRQDELARAARLHRIPGAFSTNLTRDHGDWRGSCLKLEAIPSPPKLSGVHGDWHGKSGARDPQPPCPGACL
jgi:hypothetical protein